MQLAGCLEWLVLFANDGYQAPHGACDAAFCLSWYKLRLHFTVVTLRSYDLWPVGDLGFRWSRGVSWSCILAHPTTIVSRILLSSASL